MTILKRLSTITLATTAFLSLAAQTAFAQIKNPVLSKDLGDNYEVARAGGTFLTYFVYLWRAIISVGGLAVLIYFLWGALDWITAGGDQSKIGKARDKITQSIIGLILLVGSFFIIGFISRVFFGGNFDLLRLTFPAIDGSSTTPATPAPAVPVPAGALPLPPRPTN